MKSTIVGFMVFLLLLSNLPLAKADGAQNSLTDIRVEKEAEKIRVIVTTSEPANYKPLELIDPPRLILDIEGTISKFRGKVSGEGMVKEIRSVQYKPGPTPITRVIFSLSKPLKYIISSAKNKIYVDFFEEAEVLVVEEEISPLRRKIAMNFREAEISDVLKWLSKESGLNIITRDDVKGKVTIYLKDVPVREALEATLDTKNFRYREEEHYIIVMTVKDYEKEPRRKLTKVFPLNYANAEELAKVLSEIIKTYKVERTLEVKPEVAEAVKGVEAVSFVGETAVVADVRSNSLIVTTDSPANLKVVEKLIAELDQGIAQVLIEAKLIEVTLTPKTKMGVEWLWKYPAGKELPPHQARFDQGIPPDATKPKGDSLTITALPDVTGSVFKFFVSRQDIDSVLQMIMETNDVNILSTPSILAADNYRGPDGKGAKILVGENVPYVTSVTRDATGLVTTSYEYKDVGIELWVIPQINKDKTVNLDIHEIVTKITKPGVAPTTSKTEAQTGVIVKDGYTIIIGGLFKDDKTLTEAKIPLLGHIPILGILFRRKVVAKEKKELLIFLSPHIVTTAEEAKRMTQEQKSKTKLLKLEK